MESINPFEGRDNYLKRLPPGEYQGQAYVHWTMSIQDRKTGWLIPVFYYKFREVLTHTLFRYGLCSPIFCLMPDHLHLLLVGILDNSDQRLAIRYLRKHLNGVLAKVGHQLQQQPYDHVLREEERERDAFEDVVEYIARNPERGGLIPVDHFRAYPYTSCLIPGYPELTPWQEDYWERFWRTYAYLQQHGLVRGDNEAAAND